MKSFSLARIMGFLLNNLAIIAPSQAGKLAYVLLGLPKRKKPKNQEAEFLATAEVRYEAIEGRKIAVYHWGTEGPVVLLAHGWESQAGRWRKIAPPLVQAGYQVVAVDAPAHGRSSGRHFTMIKYATALQAVIQHYGLVDTVIAHSVGGAASIWAMGALPSERRPKRAAILASFSVLQTIMDDAQRLTGASDRMMAAMDNYIEQTVGHRIPHYSLTRIAKNLEAVETLLIHDRNDKVTAYGESERLHAAWPGSRLLLTEGMGHGLTAPFVLDAVMEFVGEAAVISTDLEI